MTSISENPTVINPAKNLPRSQREALKAIASFRRHNRVLSGCWLIGPWRVDGKTVRSLIAADLVRENCKGLQLTMGGRLACDKLTGGNHGA